MQYPQWTCMFLYVLLISDANWTANGASCNWSITTPTTTDGVLRGSVDLPCSFNIANGAAAAYTVTWSTTTNTLKVIYFINAFQPPSINTWGIRASITGQASLRLGSVTTQDGGQYTCEIELVQVTGCNRGQNDTKKQGNISLVIKVPPSPPRITTSLNGEVNTDIVENSTASLYCENIGGSDPVTYKWQQVNRDSTGSMENGKYKLSISNIKRSATNYTCTVTNSAGSNSSTFTFNVQYPPGSATAVSTSPVVKATGEQTTLQCTVSEQGNPATVSFRWTKDSDTSVISTNSGSLDKNNLQISDDGTYHCTPFNAAGSGLPASILLTVNTPASITPALSSQYTAIVSQDLRIECTATAKPAATVQWVLLNGTALPGSVFEIEAPANTVSGKITTSRRVLKWKSGSSTNLRKSVGDEVQVKCTASNGVGDQATSTTRIVIQYAPGTPDLILSSVSPQVNTDITLTCTVSQSQRGNPATYTYKWRKNGVIISSSSPPNHSNVYTMRVDNINDAANYTCEVGNSVGEGSSPSADQTVSIINVPGFIHSPTSPQILSPLYNDSNFKMECIFSGNPIPADDTVVWNLGGSTLRDISKYTIRTEQVTQSFLYGISTGKKNVITWKKDFVDFTCDSVTEYDGIYRCSVNSQGQVVSSEITVKTKYPPKLRGYNIVAAQLRETKTIVCNVCAHPAPISYQWFFGNDTKLLGSQQDLTVSNIQKKNFGVYTCNVRNEVGEEKIPFELKIGGPPEPPVSMTTTERTSKSIRLPWKPGYDGGYPQSFIVRYKKTSEDDKTYLALAEIPGNNRKVISTTLQNLEPATEYRVSIQAKNTRPTKPNTSDRTQRDFSTAEQPRAQVVSVVYDGATVTVIWELLQGQPSKYTVQYRAVGDVDFLDLVSDIPGIKNNVTVDISLKETSFDFRMIAYEGEHAAVQTKMESRAFSLHVDNSGTDQIGTLVGTILGLVTTFVVLIVCSVAVLLLVRRMRSGKSQNCLTKLNDSTITITEDIGMTQVDNSELCVYESPTQDERNHSMYTELHMDTSKTAQSSVYVDLHKADVEVPRRNIKIHENIGSGAFGQVSKGSVFNLNKKHGWTTVAVKTAKDSKDEVVIKDILNELKVMLELRPHRNVVSLLGSCTRDGGVPIIIMEYLANGNLQSYLRNDRSQQKSVYGNLHGISSTITSRDLINFALDVANGMSFLSSMAILHRDLAARNILVAEDRTCKVADFGFAKDVIESHQYEKKSQGLLPVSWMSPEALYDDIFTTESDVWAYGVLLWEIVTLGSSPYPGMSPEQVMEAIKDGYRMPQPPHCSQDMYTIMLSCWEESPKDRPTFKAVCDSLKDLLDADHDVVTFGKYEEKLYEDLAQYNTYEKC